MAMTTVNPNVLTVSEETKPEIGLDVLATPGGCCPLIGNLRMECSVFKGCELLDVREFTVDGKRTYHGISMQFGDWARLIEHKDAISEALRLKRGATFPLKAPKQVKVAAYRGVWRVDIRTYFLKNNGHEMVMQPTRKGIALTPEQWSELILVLPDILALHQ
jgi:hypothetical protein